MSDSNETGGAYYKSFSRALRLLESECGDLKTEVFMAFTNMIANGDLESMEPVDVMKNAMNEWDLF